MSRITAKDARSIAALTEAANRVLDDIDASISRNCREGKNDLHTLRKKTQTDTESVMQEVVSDLQRRGFNVALDSQKISGEHSLEISW